MAIDNELLDHLRGGHTTMSRAWAITRKDGVRMGFTDHDRDLQFDGLTFRADTGLSAMALQQATGLSVDNTEAMGALSDAAITEEDIAAGRYDDAEVVAWLVNWADVSQRHVVFRGTIGEVRRAGGGFEAELRGLTEALNRPIGRAFQKPCSAVLGDAACGFDFAQPGYVLEASVSEIRGRGELVLDNAAGFEPGWFQRGRVEVIDGTAAGLTGLVKRDVTEADGRRLLELWVPFRTGPVVGDSVRVFAGCDKRFETCRLKFNNLINFQGFPDIPTEDWITVHPTLAGRLDGGSRRR